MLPVKSNCHVFHKSQTTNVLFLTSVVVLLMKSTKDFFLILYTKTPDIVYSFLVTRKA